MQQNLKAIPKERITYPKYFSKVTPKVVKTIIENIENAKEMNLTAEKFEEGRWLIDYDGQVMALAIKYKPEKKTYLVQPVNDEIILYCPVGYGWLVQVKESVEVEKNGTILYIDDVPAERYKNIENKLKLQVSDNLKIGKLPLLNYAN